MTHAAHRPSFEAARPVPCPYYMVFDADLLDPSEALIEGAVWNEYMPVAVVELDPHVTTLRRRPPPEGRYVLATDTGEWTAQQTYYGDAGGG